MDRRVIAAIIPVSGRIRAVLAAMRAFLRQRRPWQKRQHRGPGGEAKEFATK